MEVISEGKGELIGWHDPDEAREWVQKNKSRELKDKTMSARDAVSRFVRDGDFIASGGFGHDKALLQQYYPTVAAAADWVWSISAPDCRGDGIRCGKQVGAALQGHDKGLIGSSANFATSGPRLTVPSSLICTVAEESPPMLNQNPIARPRPRLWPGRGVPRGEFQCAVAFVCSSTSMAPTRLKRGPPTCKVPSCEAFLRRNSTTSMPSI